MSAPFDDAAARQVADDFHRLYYGSPERTWLDTWWMGVPLMKLPLDLWVYQELVYRVRPSLIIETGTAHGGSALYFASLCDLVGSGLVVTIDVAPSNEWPVHPRIKYLVGSSTSEEVLDQVRSELQAEGPVMVVLDSDHSFAHVRRELELYHPFVTEGSYLVVEDTNVNGRPVLAEFGPGPGEAAEDFLAAHPEFEVDPSCEKFFVSYNPGGFLRRKPGVTA